ncbi:MAG: COG4223 family protein [Magnetospiraceae bacterium]
MNDPKSEKDPAIQDETDATPEAESETATTAEGLESKPDDATDSDGIAADPEAEATAVEDTPAEDMPAPEPVGGTAAVPPPRSGGFPWATAVLGALVIAGGAYLFKVNGDVASMQSAVSGLSPKISALSKRIDALEGGTGETVAAQPMEGGVDAARIEALETAISGLSNAESAAAQIATLEKRLAALEGGAPAPSEGAVTPAVSGNLSALETNLSDLGTNVADLGVGLSALAERLDALESQPMGASTRVPALLLAIGQLGEALTGADGFSEELSTVKALAGGDFGGEALATLDPLAASGVPTVIALRDSFRPIAGDIVRAAVIPEDAGWLTGTVDRMTSVVKVRRVDGDLSGDGVDAVVARTEAALAAGDLSKAVAELGTLSGPPADKAAAWLAEAQTRVTADQAISDLKSQALAQLNEQNG